MFRHLSPPPPILLPKNSFYNSTNFTTNITNVEFPLADSSGISISLPL